MGSFHKRANACSETRVCKSRVPISIHCSPLPVHNVQSSNTSQKARAIDQASLG